ncbi:DUF6262 family protein [Skermania sp. ID1734]|uniref:DUF6262 family protein n=1 Tax=Skermania sp. ID1734 TaxID=2597516 RepID=UPI00163D41E5|nr:DUF6262 family protein [Skermania sp. ID1734]
MRADNSQHIVAAARRRSEATHRRATSALRRLDDAGHAITFDAVARAANVSRSWLYNQSDLRAEIERLRQRHRPTASGSLPDRQRASEASLLRRLEVADARIRRLEADNKQLRAALAQALGENRAAQIQGSVRDTPKRRNSALIGPC